MSCGVGCRLCSDLALLWHRPAAIALIRPLAWELPYAAGVALKKKKKKESMNKQINVFSVLSLTRTLVTLPVSRGNISIQTLENMFYTFFVTKSAKKNFL